TFGEPTDPPLLLIMGLGEQMIRWHDAFCQQLAAMGLWVIRYDNRDVGRSTKFEAAGVPNVMALLMSGQPPDRRGVPYTLSDMANDAVGLLDALEVESAHVVGVSMGGMIAQTLALQYPDRVRTLTSIMSSTGNPELPQPKAEVLLLYQQVPPENRAEYIEHVVRRQRLLAGSHYPIDEGYVRSLAGRAFDRGFYPQGISRQLAAIIISGNRKAALQTLQVPTLVIHGDADPLVSVEAGKDTAASIPGAKLLIIENMGHDIPVAVAPQILEAISQHIR
ncbi:MAG: alpha/beta fold hydrolase, partial [Candidatus Hodarchaeota archaeon]